MFIFAPTLQSPRDLRSSNEAPPAVVYSNIVNTAIMAENNHYYDFTSSKEDEIMIDKQQRLILFSLLSYAK